MAEEKQRHFLLLHKELKVSSQQISRQEMLGRPMRLHKKTTRSDGNGLTTVLWGSNYEWASDVKK